MVTFPFARNARRFVLTRLKGNAYIGRHNEGIDERGLLKQNSTSLTRENLADRGSKKSSSCRGSGEQARISPSTSSSELSS
eukprot:scaffold39452_cov40-Attheya_sp.AAC.5